MTVGRNSLGPVGLLARSWQRNAICFDCEASTLPQTLRRFSSAAAVSEPEPPVNTTSSASLISDPAINPISHAVNTTAQTHRIASAVVLSRPPMLTRDIPEFESSYYFYQRRLNDRLALPFTPYFYYKKGSLAAAEYKAKKLRNKDRYNPYAADGWKDELMVGDKRWKNDDFGYQHLLETTVTGEDVADSEEGSGDFEGEVSGEVKKALEKPLSRTTEADLKNDTRSLNRKLSRTLYLLVKRSRSEHAWKFPQTDIIDNENLQQAAQRVLEASCGVNMNTWFVGNVPIGYYKYLYPAGYKDKEGDYIGKKVFFMKARIMAGQANLANNTQDLEDFKWLTKEEIDEQCGRTYFNHVKHMLVNQ